MEIYPSIFGVMQMDLIESSVRKLLQYIKQEIIMT